MLSRICFIHFKASCYQSSWQTPLLGFSPKTRRNLKLDAIPTEFLNVSTVSFAYHTNSETQSVETNVEAIPKELFNESSAHHSNSETQSAMVQTEKNSKYKKRYKALVKENCRLRRQLKLQSYTVVAITCDLGPSNRKLLKELGIGIEEHEKCYFQHPSNDALNVFVFADPPHLIKLAHNHYIDKGFNYNGETIKKSCLEKLLVINSKNFKITHKLIQSHLDVSKTDRQKVKTATQLFSNTNAAAVEWCEGANTENHDSTELCLTNCDILDELTPESNATLENDIEFNDLFQVIENEHNISFYKPTSDEINLLEEVEQFTEAIDVIEKEGMVYIAGYVAHRFKHKYDLGQRTQFVTDPKYSWIHAVSRGG
ncbi:PREDICTED: uncharacterized protein LOC105459423, partial [Wasmannia auropunctata]|uniref:uncharacterized protein LOC105459423 n=1 Tax=Wasmannia auropunctata TaxID=64793 RepID=UPI0005F096A9